MNPNSKPKNICDTNYHAKIHRKNRATPRKID